MSTLQLKLIGLGLVALVAGLAYWRYTYVVNQLDRQRELVGELTTTLAQVRKANIAEVAHAKENTTTTQLRASDPLHGGLCDKPRLQAAAAKPVDGGTSPAAADIQPVSPGDPPPGRPGDADVRHLLDVLAGRADLLSAQLREWQER